MRISSDRWKPDKPVPVVRVLGSLEVNLWIVGLLEELECGGGLRLFLNFPFSPPPTSSVLTHSGRAIAFPLPSRPMMSHSKVPTSPSDFAELILYFLDLGRKRWGPWRWGQAVPGLGLQRRGKKKKTQLLKDILRGELTNSLVGSSSCWLFNNIRR